MKTKSMLAFALVAMFVVALCPIMDDTDAATINNEREFEFDNLDGGQIYFYVDSDTSFQMTVTVTENGKTVATEIVDVPAGNDYKVTVDMPDFVEVGTHTVEVILDAPHGIIPDSMSSFTATIVVDKNILSNWMTFIVIAIVVIVIAVFAYLKIRDAPKKKVEMTFEQLEEERKAEMAAKGEKKRGKESAPTTERQRYLADKKKKN